MFYQHIVNRAVNCGFTHSQASLIPAVSGLVNLICRPLLGLVSTVVKFRNTVVVGVSTVVLGIIIGFFGTMQSFYMMVVFSILSAVAACKKKLQIERRKTLKWSHSYRLKSLNQVKPNLWGIRVVHWFSAAEMITHHPALVEMLGIENILGGVSLLGIFIGAGQTIGVPFAGKQITHVTSSEEDIWFYCYASMTNF